MIFIINNIAKSDTRKVYNNLLPSLNKNTIGIFKRILEKNSKNIPQHKKNLANTIYNYIRRIGREKL